MTAVLPPFVVHVAAAPLDLVQRCAACQTVLLDNTAWAEGRVAVMEGDERGPAWWPTGQHIATDRSESGRACMTYVVGPPGRELADDERLCAGVN